MEDPKRRSMRRRPVESPKKKSSEMISPTKGTSPLGGGVPPPPPRSIRPVSPSKSKINTATVSFIVLSVLLLGTSLFLYKNRMDVEKKLTAEKEALLQNFQEIKQKFDIVSANNDTLKDSLSMTSSMIERYMDSLHRSRMSVNALRRYRLKFLSIRKDNLVVLKINDSLIRLVGSLTEERNSLVEQLKDQITVNDSLREAYTLFKKRLNTIAAEGGEVSGDSTIPLSKISIVGISENKKGKMENEKKVRRASKLKICFTALKSVATDSGDYSIYIKVLNSKGSILGGKKTYKSGSKSLSYSVISKFYYENGNNLDVCEYVLKGRRKFKSGLYNVEFYDSKINKLAKFSKKL